MRSGGGGAWSTVTTRTRGTRSPVKMTEMVHGVRMKLKRLFKSILLLPERNEDKENKSELDLKKPKESVEQSMGGRIN